MTNFLLINIIESKLKMLYHLLIMPQIIYHYVCLNLARHFELIIIIIHA